MDSRCNCTFDKSNIIEQRNKIKRQRNKNGGMNYMRRTGIVRRIDDLGRIVIPKEVRKTLRIKEGEPMEIFIEDDGVIFKKYDVNKNNQED